MVARRNFFYRKHIKTWAAIELAKGNKRHAWVFDKEGAIRTICGVGGKKNNLLPIAKAHMHYDSQPKFKVCGLCLKHLMD